jgi:hypothetical protein
MFNHVIRNLRIRLLSNLITRLMIVARHNGEPHDAMARIQELRVAVYHLIVTAND